MDHLHVKYLLVGGGIAALSAGRTIREHDKAGSILMVGQESTRPYQRIEISKRYLSRRVDRGDLFTVSPAWFDEHHIDLHTGRRAVLLDAARGAVSLDNGQDISFDRLLLATGASSRHLDIPGADLPGVYYLRTLEDAERLHHAIDSAPRGPAGQANAVIIGAGLLGVESAASLRESGLNVRLVESGEHPWCRFAGEATGRCIGRHLESRGIAVHAGVRPVRLEGDGRVQRVVLSDGTTHACDLVVATIGTVPHRELLRGTPIASETAILVDDRCRTNIPSIYAAGDCCVVFDPLFGKHCWLDCAAAAQATGAIAGQNMVADLGRSDVPERRYTGVNHYFSDFLDVHLGAWGEARFVDHRVIRGSTHADAMSFIEFGIAADGRIAQVLAVNHAGQETLCGDLIARRACVTGAEARLQDPSIPLDQVLSSS